MTWVRLDDSFPDHMKTQVGPVARDLFVSALCYCNRVLSDGFVPSRLVPKLVDLSDTPKLTLDEVVSRLVNNGLWETADEGFAVHDYHRYQPSKAYIESSRERARERMANFRANSEGSSREHFANSEESSGEHFANSERSSQEVPGGSKAFGSKASGSKVGGRNATGYGPGSSDEVRPNTVEDTNNIDPAIEKVLVQLKDADEETLLLVDRLLARGVPAAAFHAAYEAVELRRQRPPKLQSEARYFARAINTMLAEGQYQAAR